MLQRGVKANAVAMFKPISKLCAILICLAEKTGQYMPQDAAGRYETIQWLMWQMGSIGRCLGSSVSSTSLPAKTTTTSGRVTTMWMSRSAPECAGAAAGQLRLDHWRRLHVCRHRTR